MFYTSYFKRYFVFCLVIVFSVSLSTRVPFQTKQFKISFDQTGKLTDRENIYGETMKDKIGTTEEEMTGF